MNSLAKGLIFIAVLGVAYGVYTYRQSRTYGPFKLIISSSQEDFTAIVVELTVSAATSHSQRMVYSAHVLADSNQEIMLPRGYMSYLGEAGIPVMTVSAYHPLIEKVSKSVNVVNEDEVSGSSLIDLGKVMTQPVLISDQVDIDRLESAVKPREIDAARIQQLGSLDAFRQWTVREQLGDSLIRHFADLEHVYSRLKFGQPVQTMLGEVEGAVNELIDQTHTTPEKRQRAKTTFTKLLSMQHHE